jgi:hypothetical protein
VIHFGSYYLTAAAARDGNGVSQPAADICLSGRAHHLPANTTQTRSRIVQYVAYP